MKYSLEVKNFGKIKDAKVNLSSFTVIAGTNSSGKSFLSRALYSFFSTINKNYVSVEYLRLLKPLKNLLRFGFNSVRDPSFKVINVYNELIKNIIQIEEILTNFDKLPFEEQNSYNFILSDKFTVVDGLMNELKKELNGKKKYEDFSERLDASSRQLKQLKDTLKDSTKFLVDKLSYEFKKNLKENFQVASLADLKTYNSKSENSSFHIDGLGDIQINNESVTFQLNLNGINDFQSLYNVVFVESPIYWKLRKPLLEIRQKASANSIFSFLRDDSELSGIPKYFYDLIDLLDQDIKRDAVNNDFVDNLLDKINSELLGELIWTDSGEIYFKDKNCSKNINLNLTATGVTNLGIIGLLLKRNIISKGSYVFIDEPEVNLHPAWQKIMIETLYELSKNGINVVIATHSIDMIKYIENIMDGLSENEILNHFAINRLSNNGVSISDHLNPIESLCQIKDDLGESFMNMTFESGW